MPPASDRTLRPPLLPRVIACVATAVALGAVPGCERLLTPPQYAEVRVTVATADGTGVPDVGLTLYTGVRPMEYSQTDLGGNHTFGLVPPGNYGIAAAAPAGMCNLSGSPSLVKDNIGVAPGETQTVLFTIRACP